MVGCLEEGVLIGGVLRRESGIYEEITSTSSTPCATKQITNLTLEKCVIAGHSADINVNLKIYPNPANDYIILEGKEQLSANNKLVLMDLSGQVIMKKNNLSPATLFLKLKVLAQ